MELFLFLFWITLYPLLFVGAYVFFTQGKEMYHKKRYFLLCLSLSCILVLVYMELRYNVLYNVAKGVLQGLLSSSDCGPTDNRGVCINE